ncbi:MAG: heme-binding protein [Candidatus Rokubacteria bacterium]|nr:heme-binding protein [Candidatus Rokubacteria bacterium]
MTALTLGHALAIVEAALKKGRELNLQPLAVAVLDAGGHMKAFVREDGAGILRPQIAEGKAWGALGMGFGSRSFAKRIAEQPGAPSFFGALASMSEGRVVPVPGGVLIRDANKDVIGAVGITGDTSDNDEACALAGIAAAGLTGDAG